MATIPLKDYFDGRLAEVQKYLAARIDAATTAADKAEEQLNRRLEGMNEFRDTLKDQAARLATKEQLEALISSVDTRLKILEIGRAASEGRASIINAIVATVVSTVIGAAFLWAGRL